MRGKSLVAIAVGLLVGWVTLATATAGRPVPKQGPPAPRSSVAIANTIGVPVHRTVPPNTRIDGIVTVRNAEPTPWWDSGFFSGLLGAVVGAVIGGIFLLLGQAAEARRKRWQRHRESLARLERRCVDYLNQIISEKRLAAQASAAAEAKAVSWRFPHVFAVEPSFTVDIMDLDMNVRVAILNTEFALYNRDVEDLVRCRQGLQPLFLEGKIPDDLWRQVMATEAAVWKDMGPHLEAVDELVRDLKVRAVILVEQFDSEPSARRRFFGLGKMKTEPLSNEAVHHARQEFEAERERHLKANRELLNKRHGVRVEFPDQA